MIEEFQGTFENPEVHGSPFSTYEAFGSLLFFLRHICFPKFSVSRMLTNKDENLEFLSAIPAFETVKDDARNMLFTEDVIPFLRKVELNNLIALDEIVTLSIFLFNTLFVIAEQR
jgi:hypothetical protein